MSSGRRWLQSCIIVALSVGYGSHSPDAGSLLADFIPFLRIPLRVAVFVCWNNEKSVRFARKLLAREHHGQPPHFLQLRNESVDNLSVLDTLEPHQHLAVVDRACPNAGRFLLEAQYRIYHKIRWVILNGDQVEMEHREVEIFEILSSLPITGNSNLFYFVRSVEGKILVKDVYRISMNTGLISSVVAIWQNGTFTDAGISQPVSIRRRNLHRAPIRSTLVYTNNYTLNHFDDYENTQIDTHSRTGYILVKALYDIYLNATMEKRFTASWCYSGSPGLCSDLVDGLSDAGASVMFMRAARLKLVEYIKLPVPAYIRFIYKTPKLSTTDNIFRLPFNSSVWGCTIGLIIFAGGLLLVVSVVQRRIDRKRVDLVDATFDIIPIAMQQGLMFMEVSFSAKIISLIQAPSEKISTLKDLLESKLEVGSEDTPYNRHFLSTATEPVRRALVDQKLKRKNGSLNLYDVPEGIGKIREGLFAFHVYTSTGYKFVGETFEDVEKCSLRELAFLDNSEAYIPVKKNFTLREHFHVGLMRIMEMGIYAREQRKMHFVKPSCTKGVHFQPLNTLDIRFAVQLMAWGVTTAILLLLVEAIWSRCSRASRVPVLPYVE